MCSYCLEKRRSAARLWCTRNPFPFFKTALSRCWQGYHHSCWKVLRLQSTSLTCTACLYVKASGVWSRFRKIHSVGAPGYLGPCSLWTFKDSVWSAPSFGQQCRANGESKLKWFHRQPPQVIRLVKWRLVLKVHGRLANFRVFAPRSS